MLTVLTLADALYVGGFVVENGLVSITPVPGIGDGASRPDLAVGAVGATPSSLNAALAERLAAAHSASNAAAARYSSTTVSRPGLPHDALYRLTSPNGLMIVSGSGAASGTVPSALALPLTPDGVPDVQTLRDNDVIVRGAIPPNGEAVRSQSSMLSHQAYFAFEIDFQDGNGPLFVKGGNVRFDPHMSNSPQASALAQNTLEAIRRLPNSYAEYQQQRGAPTGPGAVDYTA